MSKGFNGMPGNIQAMMKQAQKMQQELQKVQEGAEGLTAEGAAGGKSVVAVVNAKGNLVSLTLDKQVVNPEDVEMLQDLIVAAVNDGVTKAQGLLKEQMSKVTGGLSIPGLF